MKKWTFRIILGFAAVVVLFVATAAIALATFDPNERKADITAAVKRATGRDLTIAGNIGITFFPVLGFEAHGVQVSNPPGFIETEFLSAGQVSAGVKLLPLLSRNVEVTNINIKEPHINIIKRVDGSNNLQLTQPGKQLIEQSQDEDVSIDSITISNASVTYTDHLSGKSFLVESLNMTIPGFKENQTADLTTDMMVKSGSTDMETAIDIKASIMADTATGMYAIESLTGDMTLNPGPGIDKVRVSLFGTGTVNTRTEEIALENLKATWGSSSAEATAYVQTFATPSVSFTLAISRLDMSQIRSRSRRNVTTESNNKLLPVDALQNMILDGSVTITELKVARLTATNIEAAIKGQNGLITIDPLRMNIYGGSEQDRIVIDARTEAPTFNINGKAESIQAGPLLRAQAGHDYVTGILNADYSLMATGNTMSSLRETAGGKINISFTEGRIKKWQLSKLLNQAVTFFETGNINPNSPDEFRFTSMNATFDGNQGIFYNDDLVIVAPGSHALGAGNISLQNQTVDYSLQVGLGDDPVVFKAARHLPIRIQGPLSTPGYSLDFEAVAAEALRQTVKERLMRPLPESLNIQEPAAGEEGNIEDTFPSELFKGLMKGQ